MSKKLLYRLSAALTSMFCAIAIVVCFATPTKAAASEEFQIGIFFMPTWPYVNPTQFDYIEDAHVNLIQTFYPNDLQMSTIAQMNGVLGLANSRGIKVQVSDSRSAPLMTTATNADIAAIANTYKNHPATGGYYIKDEPGAGDWPRAAAVYNQFQLNDPDSVSNVNLIAYTGATTYNNFVQTMNPFNLKYLTMDSYPFPAAGGINGHFYQVRAALRSAALSNNVKMAEYLQSVGIPNNLRRPNANEMRWHVYNSLAYGMKGLYWFTWFQPVLPPNTEVFTTAIFDSSGNKTDLYTPVQTLNAEVEKLGPTLMSLTSRDVYMKGTRPIGTTLVPANYFWSPTTNYDQVISHFANGDGRSYIMVVNRDYANSRSLSFNLPTKPANVTEVSKSTGAEVATNYSNATGNVSASFLPGEGKLYAISTDFALPAETIDDTHTGIIYGGSSWMYSWARNVGDYSDDLHHATTNNDFFEYTFIGTGVDFISEKDPSGGNVDMYIDGVLQTTISTYGTTSNQSQQTVYSKSGLTYGPHTIKAVKKTGTYMVLDALKIYPGTIIRPAARTNDTSAGIAYSGTGWKYSEGRGSGDMFNDVHATTANNDYFEYTFKGTGVEYVTETDPTGGDVDIYIDGVLQSTVSTVGAKLPKWQHCAAENATCSFSGTKTVRYGANGLYNTGSFTGSVACTNAVFGDPAPGVVKTCSYDNSSVQPTNWITCANEGWACDFTGTRTIRYIATNGASNSGSYTNTVNCTNAVFGDPASGIVKTCEYETINNIPTNKSQQAVYVKTGLTYGTHTIKGVKKSGTYMLLDGFNVLMGSNLVANPGFESGTTASWTASSGSTISADSVNKRTGSYGGKAIGRTAPWSGFEQNVASVLTANGRGNYNLSGWLKLASGSDRAQLAIRIVDSLGTHWVNTDYKGITSTDWTQTSKIVNIQWTGKITSATLYVQTETSLANQYVDDLTLSR